MAGSLDRGRRGAVTEAPALPLTGGCECGATRYRIDAAPIGIHLCHCRECQRQSGSAFGMSVVVPVAALAFTAAPPASWQRPGSARESRFCAVCGTRLAHVRAAAGVAAVKAGTLDDTSWLRPERELWDRERQRWPLVDPARPRFPEGVPPRA